MEALTLLSQQVRQGIHTSSTYAVPAFLTGVLRVVFVLRDQDKTDPAYSFDAKLYVSEDEGETWSYKLGYGWKGSDYTPKPGSTIPWPSLYIDASLIAGNTIRVDISIPVAFRVGVQVVTD